jgi:hypothetical protein
VDRQILAAIEAAGAAATKVLGARVPEQKPLSMAVQRSLRFRSAWSALGGALRRVTLGVYRNRVSAILAGSGGVEIVGLQTPARPTLAAILPDAAGAMPLAGGLLSWNERGLWYDGRQLAATDGPVEAVIARGGYFYALGRPGVLIFNERLEHAGTLASAGATGIAVAGSKLVLAGPDGLRTFDLANPEQPRAGAKFPLEGIRAIDVTAIGGTRRVLVELSDGPFVIVDVAGERSLEAARYLQRPWFAGSATLRDVTVRPSGAGNVEVFTTGTWKTMRF